MPQMIHFFPRQAFPRGVTDIYSEIYDVSDYAQVVAELKLYAYSGTGSVSAVLQDCMDSTFAPDSLWRDVASQSLAATGVGATFSASALLRFARVKFSMATFTGAVVASVEAEARDKT